MSTTSKVEDDDLFESATHVYEPHKAGLPPLKPYFREVWRRREFIVELSRSMMNAAQTRTFFGRMWLVLNPLLLSLVYFFLLRVLRGGELPPDTFARLTSGLFVFHFVSQALTGGSGSVVGGGRLIMNASFPRLMLPITAVRTAFFRFLPTLPVFYVIFLLSGLRPSWQQLFAIPALVSITMFAMGLAALLATVQVYFRDTSTFMPYLIRIWLYTSPVLWYYDAHHAEGWLRVMWLNPLYSMIGAWSDALVRCEIAPWTMWVVGLAWGVATLVLGCLFFMSREREFAVRL